MVTAADTLGPPPTSVGVLGWLKKNLFNTWYNALLTIVLLWVLASIGVELLRWALTEARWEVVTSNLRLFMVGPYPPDQVWRVWLVLLMVSALFGLSAGAWGGTVRSFANALAAAYLVLAILPFLSTERLWLIANLALIILGFVVARGRTNLRRYLLVLWLVSFGLTLVLLEGFGLPFLTEVSTAQWGGLLLTFMLAIVSIVASFPIGVLLALGRRSKLPAVHLFSILYIELVRGVPLVTILFMADIMVPLFLGDFRPDRVLRAIVGMTAFTAAYMAENVRGGLQAIPTGQVEAAQALGLGNAMVTGFIVLPQALRMVIPATVGLFISLFKDTTLVSIMGLLEILGVGRSVLAQPQYLGLQNEVYVFIAVVFFICCYAMSFASYRLEEALGVGKR